MLLRRLTRIKAFKSMFTALLSIMGLGIMNCIIIIVSLFALLLLLPIILAYIIGVPILILSALILIVMGLVNGLSTIGSGEILESIKGFIIASLLAILWYSKIPFYIIYKIFEMEHVNCKGEEIIIMRKLFFSFLILFILSACSQGENIDTIEDEDEDEVLSIQDVEIPDVIFTSEKQESVIDEEEIKLSIKIYLDSNEELSNASEPFQDYIYEEKELNIQELQKLDKINKLTKENDENFSNYILNNTLPEGYQEESKRISRYITAVNETLYEIGEMFDNLTNDASEGVLPKVNVKSLIDKSDVVNGREQKKIEDFLDKKNINTKAFGREH